jgi:hypothetical protein
MTATKRQALAYDFLKIKREGDVFSYQDFSKYTGYNPGSAKTFLNTPGYAHYVDRLDTGFYRRTGFPVEALQIFIVRVSQSGRLNPPK